MTTQKNRTTRSSNKKNNNQGLINLGDYLSKALYELDAKEAKPLFKHKDK